MIDIQNMMGLRAQEMRTGGMNWIWYGMGFEGIDTEGETP
jgi:hypothetical protein